MTFPAGVVVRNVTLTPFLDSSGVPIDGTLIITPATALKWTATNQIVLRDPVSVATVNGIATISLPVIQSGFTQADNIRIDAWTYTASMSLPPGGDSVSDLLFALPVGTGDYTLDFTNPTEVTGTILSLVEYVPLGEVGPTGPPTNISIGTVTTTSGVASAVITGTPPNLVLDLNLPKGDPGDPGPVVGVQAGGTAGQIYTKISVADNDATWTTPRYPPVGGTTGQVLKKIDGTDHNYSWQTDATGSGVPTGGTTGQFLKKNSGTNFDASFANLPTVNEVPTAGTTGQALRKNSNTNYDASWLPVREIPSGGSNAQVLAKTSGTDYAVGWVNPATGSGVPIGGTTNQVLKKNSNTDGDAVWAAVPAVTAASLPAGSVMYVLYAGSWPVRPTARTDIMVFWVGPSTPAPPVGGTGILSGTDQKIVVAP